MEDIKVLYLSGAEVSRLGAGDMKTALAEVEQAFKLVYQGDCILPEKISMGFGKKLEDESTMGRINAMPAYLGGCFHMAGIKWIGSAPLNAKIGLPRASSITILNDPETKFPICMMNGSEISAVRTGASTGVAAKYLARKDAETLMLVGAGYQNRMQLEAIYCNVPNLKNFYVVDIIPEMGRKFAEEMGEKLGIEITPLTAIGQCKDRVDISVNATSSPKPVMELSVVNPGGMHACIGGLDHPDLYQQAARIYCDAWDQVKHRASCFLALDAIAGKITDEDIYCPQIGAVICGDKDPRRNDEEFLYYKPVGMGTLDLAVATRIYRNAREQGIGTWLDY